MTDFSLSERQVNRTTKAMVVADKLLKDLPIKQWERALLRPLLDVYIKRLSEEEFEVFAEECGIKSKCR